MVIIQAVLSTFDVYYNDAVNLYARSFQRIRQDVEESKIKGSSILKDIWSRSYKDLLGMKCKW